MRVDITAGAMKFFETGSVAHESAAGKNQRCKCRATSRQQLQAFHRSPR